MARVYFFNRYIITLIFTVIVISSCKKDENTKVQEESLSAPEIVKIEASKYEIKFGGADYTTITATATGGDLEYLWEVDLGDIIPQSDKGDVINFSGSACCIGEKEIILTVSNKKGQDKDTIIIEILAP